VITMVSDWKPKLPKPKRRPQPKKGASALDRFRAYLRQQVDELARHDPVARLDDDPERIHQIRVATRRARSALRTARPLLDLERAADAPRVRTAHARLDKLARKEFGRLRRAVRALGTSPSDEALHEVRKRGKRARYAAELAGGKRAKKFAEAAKSFQDVVGDH